MIGPYDLTWTEWLIGAGVSLFLMFLIVIVVEAFKRKRK